MTTKTMHPILKLLLVAWTINLFIFVPAIFIESYTQAANHWSENAWEAVMFTTSMTKLVLSVTIYIYIGDCGIWEKR